MESQGDNWGVVDYTCRVSVLDIIEHNELQGMEFSMDIKARIIQQHVRNLEEVERVVLEVRDEIWLSEKSENQMRVDLLKDKSKSRIAINGTLCDRLNVPDHISGYLAEKIIDSSLSLARSNKKLGTTGGVVVRMEVFVYVYVVEAERVRMENSKTMCAFCEEEFMIGSEATRMLCSHLYHGGCIVKWLEQDRFCPLCQCVY